MEKTIKFEKGPGKFVLINRVPAKITHELTGGMRFGFLLGISFCLGLILTFLVMLGIVMLIALLISP
ncbi:MAG: hypothetical protein FJ044_03190 [Candidatus Cloacimonetes bacterium]|nr:hypothetical protein [Candidatus Cloacimonadota bacterium]